MAEGWLRKGPPPRLCHCRSRGQDGSRESAAVDVYHIALSRPRAKTMRARDGPVPKLAAARIWGQMVSRQVLRIVAPGAEDGVWDGAPDSALVEGRRQRRSSETAGLGLLTL